MAKDLTSSRLDRQNILNNEIAIEEIQTKAGIEGVLWCDKVYVTREITAKFFEVDIRTVSRYVEQNNEELTKNGYEVLKGKRLKEFIESAKNSGKDINVPTKTTVLGVFDFRAFLNLAMLMSESDKARALRQLMLDIVIDLINRKTGGGTKYINQRDKDFLYSSLQEDNYRRQFTDALKLYVEEDRYKYAHFTDMIYVSIFKEKAKEYKKILDLKATDKVRDTFYSEILDIIAAYESGLSDAIKQSYEKKGRVLTRIEAEQLFGEFENMALWNPLIQRGRIKMASRDMALREAFHYQLSEYIQPLDKNEYQKFLDVAGDELEHGAVYSDYAVMPFDMNGVKASDEEGTRVITDYEETGKLIVIDNADILLDDDARKYISLDDKNQYLIIGRNPKNLFATSDNLFELVSERNGEQTEFRLEHYL